MGRTPCCDGKGVKKGPWTPEEDKLLVDFVQANGSGNWRLLPKLAERIYLFTNEWSMIAAQLPGRTDNEIKNYWNTHLKKQLRLESSLGAGAGEDNAARGLASSPAARHMAQWETARLEAEARLSLLSSSATSATASSSSSAAEHHHAAALEPDIFLRLWNSEVGESFRIRGGAAAQPPANAVPALMVAAPGDDHSSAVSTTNNNAAATMADEYQAFLDLAVEEFALLHGRLGSFAVFPAADMLAGASLFTPFE
ncbi:hypothetical protein PR202_gb14866 [Eleusine coracana subsp. coracana]|uniref:Uncharacterized protein n=1 Tax=Eleusine coracana subsp. coracana TaxID=191504 RepID=A0AAV5EWH5_ELECO|nr:hypothetical protein PR202_gb14866 [Eleusine coracana subsp. coracana]